MKRLALSTFLLMLTAILLVSYPAQAVQSGRADSDVTDGGWEDTTGGDGDGANWDEIDEATADDGTTYTRADGSATAMEVGLSDVTDPVSSSGHIIRFRAFATGSGGPERITFALVETSTVRASINNQAITRSSWNTYSYTLSTAEADAIGDYTDLRFRFTPSMGGGSERLDITWAELEVPDAGPGWSNTAPSIDQSFTTREGGHNISYEEALTATDPDTNQSLTWSLATNGSFLAIEYDNRSAWVNGTPLFAGRDQSYYVNATADDGGCAGACALTDFLNWTLYINNTLPVITNPISEDSGTNGTAYSRDFDFTDANSDTPSPWAVDTDAPFTLSISGTGEVTGTPDLAGTFWVNVTVRDYTGGQGGTDFTNYTLTISEDALPATDGFNPLWIVFVLVAIGAGISIKSKRRRH